MKQIKGLSFGILFLSLIGLFSCVNESANSLETLPYFDLKGFIESKTQEVNGVEVVKDSQIKGEKNQTTVIYTTEDWKEELKIFTDADINRTSLLQSYETTTSDDMLSHELLPNSKGNVKYIKVTYFEDEVSSVSIKIAEENMFYTSTTVAEIYMNKSTKLVDHYTIGTTQKIWFVDANDMKIQGKIVSN
ncbi:hypothetical protein [Algoriphagus aquimarinus]|uniref:hypothetical protein n=1 Tax=Algoriphagus aquimarinus TaxID=237018 RepID=UPI0030DC02E4|tara:strand:- start:184647 stop:185216 length:570 start_codon:yes stop_codon:yes gene_type:complete